MADGDSVVPDRRIAKSLETLKHVLANGNEFWYARDLQGILGYTKWQNFEEAISRAKASLEGTGNNPSHHFADISKKVPLGKGGSRDVGDVALTRLAAYLVAMNGDPSKPQIASAQQYFAAQTRRQELTEQMEEADKRIALRDRVRKNNAHLFGAAKQAGVQRFDVFQSVGYQGLYGGMTLRDIKQIKGLTENSDLLDHAGRTELAANDFRITQTEEALRNQTVVSEQQANATHQRVGTQVRESIANIGGTMPERLPAETDVKKLVQAKKRAALPKPKKL